MSVTDEIKTRLDIVNYIHQVAPLKKAGRNYKATCPFHSEKTPSFVVNPESQTWRCFGSCAEGGDIFSFAQKYHGWSFPEALEELGKLAGIEVHQQSADQKQQSVRLDELRGLMQTAADFYHEHLWHNQDVLAYTRDRRGFIDETIVAYGIGYAPDGWQHSIEYLTELGYAEEDLIEVGLARRSEQGRVYDYFRHRLMIPIRDERGRVIGFGARALSDEDNPKYLNSPQTPLFDKSRVLFGLDRAKRMIRDDETAVIVEGYMDVIQAHQAGFMNVVAQMGTAMTETQLKTLAPRWAKKIVLALDADSAGQSATMRSLEVARETLRADYLGRLKVDIHIMRLPGAKDPDDLIRETPELWPSLVHDAQPVVDYVLATELASLPENASLLMREELANRLIPLLSDSENILHNRNNMQQLGISLKLPEGRLAALAVEYQQKKQDRLKKRLENRSDMPEPPPVDYEESPAPTVKRESNRWEVFCLRGLLQQPDVIYHINRKLREVADADEILLDGPLRDFEAEDFRQQDYQALMGIFLDSLEQDEYRPVDYVKAYLEDILIRVLEEDLVLADDSELVGVSVQHRFSSDRQDLLTHLIDADKKEQVLRMALNMRLQRLKRESEELRFHIQDLESDPFVLDYHRQYAASVKAFQLLDNALKNLAQTM